MNHPRHLPLPLLDRYAWQFQGVCRQADPALFFPESTRGNTRTNLVAQAKAVCSTCPVISECRAHGLTVEEPYGIWGGLTVHERRIRSTTAG